MLAKAVGRPSVAPAATARLHGLLVRGGEHVGGRTLHDLVGQGGAGVEREAHVDAGVLLVERLLQLAEGAGERGGGQHGEGVVVPAAASAAAGGGGPEREDQGRGDGVPHGSSTTTLVDFTEAIATTPGSSPSSSAASLLINETIR